MWWRQQRSFAREDYYALFEFLHAIRDNTKIDLRETALAYFDELPLDYVAGILSGSVFRVQRMISACRFIRARAIRM
ncbi:MAG: hypothetical protein WDO18_00710 [Acidobacteriota bacterium]